MKSVKLQLEEDGFQNKAYDYAVFLLGIRLRTEGELREKLRNKQYEMGVIDQVIEQLKDSRYINDQNYAEVFLDNLKKYKNFGYYGIKKKMMEKRLPMGIIEQVLSEELGEEEEQKIAVRFLKNHELGIMNYEEKPQYHSAKGGSYGVKQKLAQKLKSRGFRGSVIAKLLF